MIDLVHIVQAASPDDLGGKFGPIVGDLHGKAPFSRSIGVIPPVDPHVIGLPESSLCPGSPPAGKKASGESGRRSAGTYGCSPQ